jgi:hypothetical protein
VENGGVAACLATISVVFGDEVKRVQTMDAQTRQWFIAMCIAIALLILSMALHHGT